MVGRVPFRSDVGVSRMSADADDRLLRLETAVAHLQHDFERIHSVALELQDELRLLTNRLARSELQLQRFVTSDEAPLPENERPPHY